MDNSELYKPKRLIKDVYEDYDFDAKQRFKELGLSPYAHVGYLADQTPAHSRSRLNTKKVPLKL